VTQYLLAVHNSDRIPELSAQERRESVAQTEVLNAALREAGAFVFAGALRPAESATVVQQSGTDVMVSDGPFAETKEHLAGFWIIEAGDLDEALAWTRQATLACRAPVEIRPFADEPPAGSAAP
jgi:hypothetical protein